MIKYIPETHQYFVDDKEVPSVNQILKAMGAIPDFDFPAAERKRKLGTYVHAAIRLYFLQKLDEASLQGEVKEYFEGFKKFMADYTLNPFAVEKPLFSSKWNFCGTPDCWDNRIFDWKNSVTTYPHYSLQMGAYDILVEETGIKPKEVLLIKLSPYDYKPEPIQPNRQGFLAFNLAYQWLKENKRNGQ